VPSSLGQMNACGGASRAEKIQNVSDRWLGLYERDNPKMN